VAFWLQAAEVVITHSVQLAIEELTKRALYPSDRSRALRSIRPWRRTGLGISGGSKIAKVLGIGTRGRLSGNGRFVSASLPLLAVVQNRAALSYPLTVSL
jgi:hypothetical protein